MSKSSVPCPQLIGPHNSERNKRGWYRFFPPLNNSSKRGLSDDTHRTSGDGSGDSGGRS
jgi:hypothetical protein